MCVCWCTGGTSTSWLSELRRLSDRLYALAENLGLLLCWPLMLCFIFTALGIEHVGVWHISLERKVHPVLMPAPAMYTSKHGPLCAGDLMPNTTAEVAANTSALPAQAKQAKALLLLLSTCTLVLACYPQG